MSLNDCLHYYYEELKDELKNMADENGKINGWRNEVDFFDQCSKFDDGQIPYLNLYITKIMFGFIYKKIQNQEEKQKQKIESIETELNKKEERIAILEAENAKLRSEFKEVLSALSVKKPVGEEIAELQERIMKLYAESNSS